MSDRATFYRQVMNDHMARDKGKDLYKTKFKLPFDNDLKENLIWLMDANDLVLPSMRPEEKETLAVKSKEEGYLYFLEEKFDKAIEAYNNALQVTSSSEMRH